eukprot:Sspe_Gene.36672::Locus_17717_Transcript_1_1_Confidence_1.000_Length_821::g.36672::m.36672
MGCGASKADDTNKGRNTSKKEKKEETKRAEPNNNNNNSNNAKAENKATKRPSQVKSDTTPKESESAKAPPPAATPAAEDATPTPPKPDAQRADGEKRYMEKLIESAAGEVPHLKLLLSQLTPIPQDTQRSQAESEGNKEEQAKNEDSETPAPPPHPDPSEPNAPESDSAPGKTPLGVDADLVAAVGGRYYFACVVSIGERLEASDGRLRVGLKSVVRAVMV